MEQLDQRITTVLTKNGDEDYVALAELEALTEVEPGEPDTHWEEKLGPERLRQHRQEMERIVRAQQEAEHAAGDVFVGM